MGRLAGPANKQRLQKLASEAMNRPNPLLQLFYLSIIFTSHYLYAREIMPLMPQPYAPVWHQ